MLSLHQALEPMSICRSLLLISLIMFLSMAQSPQSFLLLLSSLFPMLIWEDSHCQWRQGYGWYCYFDLHSYSCFWCYDATLCQCWGIYPGIAGVENVTYVDSVGARFNIFNSASGTTNDYYILAGTSQTIGSFVYSYAVSGTTATLTKVTGGVVSSVGASP